MQKDFAKWHGLKTSLNNDKPRIFFHEGEIWFAHLGQNVGFEQDGQNEDFLRPVLVYKKFNKEIFLAIPLSKTDNDGKFYFKFSYLPEIVSTAILSQIRLLDAKRLKYKSGSISLKDLKQLKEKLRRLIA